EHEDGRGDPLFDAGNGPGQVAGKGPESHGKEECRRQEPRGAQLRRPESNRSHGEDMIPPAEGMLEAAVEARCGPEARVGARERDGAEEERDCAESVGFGLHEVFAALPCRMDGCASTFWVGTTMTGL